MRRTAAIAMIAGGIAALWLCARRHQHPASAAASAARPETHPVDTRTLPEVLVDPSLLLEKSARRISLLSAGEPVKRYQISLGSEPMEDKEREGDGRTPHGAFYVCTRGATPRYACALGISYPSEEDADRGLATGLISKREHRSITQAIHRMQRPPWNTNLGGEIMIHGGGLDGDWTAGCIALDDDEMAELFDAVPLGTPVEILP